MELSAETALQICCNPNRLELTIGHRKEDGRDQYRFTIGRSGEIPWFESAPYLTDITARRQLLSTLLHSLQQTQEILNQDDYLCRYLDTGHIHTQQSNGLLSGEQIAHIAQQLEQSNILTT